MINIELLVKDKINTLWREFGNEEYCRFSPNSIAEIPNDGLIFIGINPSMTDKVKERLIEKNDINCEFHKLTYNVERDYRYFKKFFDVAEKTGLNWGHMDLLYNRETNQKKVAGLLKTERGRDFIYKQCMISKNVLDQIIDKKKPRIFVVNNTLARELLGEYHSEKPTEKSNHWIGYDFVWNEDYGTYVYKNNAFFFTSMLTGQRALDNGSYQRLIWHINLVKEKQSA
ncbi:hypothetical protein [Psychroserpens damuponensis]|uniref:hypothetical protein n=1 Tax=Psychroserpens damuponensis TaxID=943936 RepID=UPI00058D4BFF|nr:hypothetical protein [Psychroserpens damuponensis]